METLLNLLWLVIACATVCLWRGVWRRNITPSMREWLAFATLLFLLFPVISLTDDLHEELAVAECATGTKHFLSAAHGVASQHHTSRHVSAPSAVLPSQFWPGLMPKSARLIRLDARVEASAPGTGLSGRSPPFVSL